MSRNRIPRPATTANFVCLALTERSKNIIVRPIPTKIAIGPEKAIPMMTDCVKSIDVCLQFRNFAGVTREFFQSLPLC